MKRLSKKEFSDRVAALARAKKIFVRSGITTNITKAFELYQEILAEKERPIFISSKTQPKLSDEKEFVKPLPCPDCGGPLSLRHLPPKGKNNRYGYGSMWYCTRGDCLYEQFNSESVKKIVSKLKEEQKSA